MTWWRKIAFRINPPATSYTRRYSRQVVGRSMQPYMQTSLSRKGNCWDNAPTESLWGSLKVGRLYGKTFATQRMAMDEVID